ncbi:hypothetical protein M0805_001433 [Coniferiporia weirii]|nr:hypothetical protein M0805_001433 [Coniferiporia weirii]
MLPPGINLLLAVVRRLLAHSLPPAAVVCASAALLDYDFGLPYWLWMLLLMLSMPFVMTGKIIWSNLRNKWEARTFGAVPPPVVKSYWPGGIDTLFSVLQNDKKGYPMDVTYERSKLLGWTFNWRLFWEDKIFTCEPEHVKAILASEFNNYEKGDIFKEHMHSVLGDGVFNSDGEMWKFHRTMTRPFFSKDRISHFEVFGRHADKAIGLMRARLGTGHAVDFQDLVSRFTMDSATEFLFGHCVNSLSSSSLPYSPNAISETTGADANSFATHPQEPLDLASRFSEAFAEAQTWAIQRARYGTIWALFEFWEDKTLKHMKTINAFIDPILNEAVEKKKKFEKVYGSFVKKEIEDDGTLLDHLIDHTNDTKVLRDEILNILIAGRDTTAVTLTFALYCLAMHPDVLKRLREEILAVVGSDRSPTYDDLKEMKYLKAVINETLRLYPPVPLNVRSTVNATTLPNKTPGAKPWYVPARTKVVYSVFLMHRREDLWGPDAIEFDPARFLDARLHTYLTPDPFIFLPFNAGPRICLGQQFAYNEVSFMLVRLLQAFSGIALAPDAQPHDSQPPAEWAHAAGTRKSRERVWPKCHLTLYVHGGLWVRLEEAARTVGTVQ